MNKRTTPTAFRLSNKGRGLLAALAEKLGVNQTAVVEMAIRQMAEKEKVEAQELPEQA
jgi:predicted transcriptional regulator